MKTKEKFTRTIDTVKRAFAEFLTVPTLIIAGFLAFAFASYTLDKTQIEWFEPVRNFLKSHVFANAKATSDLLGAIAAGIIAVTSITITLLLIIAQQSAASMTAQVFDQFLRRKTNQIYFGFFVGLALYSLVTLATVNNPFNPIFGAASAFLLTVAALYLLVLLLYTTVNQMRPVEIVEAIHGHILLARKRQLETVRRTRRASRFDGTVSKQIESERHGYVTQIDFDKIGARVRGEAEVVLLVSLGSFVAFGDALAQVKTNDAEEAEIIGEAVAGAIRLKVQRDIEADAAYGIEQLETIGWTSVSTSKSNPAPGLIVIHSLRVILARWSADKAEDNGENLPIVYSDDTPAKLFNAFETLAIVSSESMQHQIYIEILKTFTTMFDRLPDEWRTRVEDSIFRILSALGDHVLTAELDIALSSLAQKLESSGRGETASAVRAAQKQLRRSIGKLNSRSTRVPTDSS